MHTNLKISVVIRVFNRLTDLKICLETIHKYWKSANYTIIVVGNGKSLGFGIDDISTSLADKVIQLENNAGHLQGNSQLLHEGIKHIPSESDYTVILEADTWIFSDDIIVKYAKMLKKDNAVWASAEWIEKYHSLALDFAIIDSKYLVKNPEIFNFTVHPESFVCNYLRNSHVKYKLITECMPVHIPSFMRRFYNPYTGRMRSFSKSKIVTHHIEDLKNGIEDKKRFAEIVLNRHEFSLFGQYNLRVENLKLKIIELLMKITPRSRWIKPKREKRI